MSEVRLPKLFRDALDALAAVEAAIRTPPHTFRRRWNTLLLARTALRQEYPRLEFWLFPAAGRQEARQNELLRLIAEAQKEASDE